MTSVPCPAMFPVPHTGRWKAPLLTHRHLHGHSHTHVTTQNILSTHTKLALLRPTPDATGTSLAVLPQRFWNKGHSVQGHFCIHILVPASPYTLTHAHLGTYTTPSDNASLRLATASWRRQEADKVLAAPGTRKELCLGRICLGTEAQPSHPT